MQAQAPESGTPRLPGELAGSWTLGQVVALLLSHGRQGYGRPGRGWVCFPPSPTVQGFVPMLN